MQSEVFTSYDNVISSLGFTTKENYTAILNNEIGVKSIKFGIKSEEFCLSVIEDKKIDSDFSELKSNTNYTKLEKLSILSINEVLNASGISLSDKETLLIYSTTKGNINLLDSSFKNTVPKERVYLSSMAQSIANHFNAINTPIVVSNACISGLLAIILAKRLITNGNYKNIIVCGGDLVTEFTVSGFKSFNALSNYPCKPFDAHRNGINLGEAVSSVLITSDITKLQAASMKIISGATANDANHISGPSRTGEGLYKALQHTFRNNKELHPDVINAHGTATPYNDEMESIAFERMGLVNSPINSLKGYYGHTLGAAGVLETVLTIHAANENSILKSNGFTEKGVSGNVLIAAETIKKNISTILKTASGFGGCNASALFTKL